MGGGVGQAQERLEVAPVVGDDLATEQLAVRAARLGDLERHGRHALGARAVLAVFEAEKQLRVALEGNRCVTPIFEGAPLPAS
jgi:hypothetical protein